jgi:mRNA interferase YafQ
MTLKLEQTKSFKKCLKKYRHRKLVLEELKKVVELLVNNKPIPVKYRDHELAGEHKGIRELHLKPDDLLLYVKKHHEKITLMAIGSHSEIF